MNVDIGNAMAEVTDAGVDRTTLETLDEQVGVAHERIERARANDEFGYVALDLPETAATERIESVAGQFPDAEAVLTVGIGGSALGAATITTALGPNDIDHYVLDNVDPERTTELLKTLPLEQTVVNVVSRSGTTTETLANFLVIRETLRDADVDWTERTVVTTGQEGPLDTLATRHDLARLDVPVGVPGRYSALSAVGLLPAAIQGQDLDAILEGASLAADSLADSLYDCPAYAYGALSYALAERDIDVTVMMPYAERLEPFAEWFAQLWAESLGKDGRGQTPVRALGATDQHSQLQLYRAGPIDKLVTFVRIDEWEDRTVPAIDLPGTGALSGKHLGEILEAELEATEASLAVAGQPNVRFELDRLDAHGIGWLLYTLEAACILAGELFDVDTFSQPAVEWGKQATRGLLGQEATEEAAAVADKHRLIVE